MEQIQMWLKLEPRHIDENIVDFLKYMKSHKDGDLYNESLRLLDARVDEIVESRAAVPVFRYAKDIDTLKLNIRILGAWLLCGADCEAGKKKLVFVAMLNLLLEYSQQSPKMFNGKETICSKSIPLLINLVVSLLSHKMPEEPVFAWNDILADNFDLFLNKIGKLVLTENEPGYYQRGGSFYASEHGLMISNLSINQLQKGIKSDKLWQCILSDAIGLKLYANKSEKINTASVSALDELFSSMLAGWPKRNSSVPQQKEVKPKKNYYDGDRVPVEVVKIDKNPQTKETAITLKTIDPSHNEIIGKLYFNPDLRIFSNVYKPVAWGNVLQVGQRFNAVVNTTDNTFSITSQFLDYLHELVYVGVEFDANNNRPKEDRLNGREFWADCGCMVYVDLADTDEEEDLKENYYDARIEITESLSGKYDGCFKGVIVDFDVENKNVQRDEYCPKMLKEFLESISDISLEAEDDEDVQEEPIELSQSLIKEFCFSLNILQKRESNPLDRFRQLCAIRLICKMSDWEEESGYFKYISEYIKTLIAFAHADTNEGSLISQITAPEALHDEESIENGSEILKILSCFAKDYDETCDVLNNYIDGSDSVLCKTASLVQSYNRLQNIIDKNTLREIKTKILECLSVVVSGDSTLNLQKETIGEFGVEDVRKEFKASYYTASNNEEEAPHHIFKGLCALMNTEGGQLLVGVDNNGNAINGGVDDDIRVCAKRNNCLPNFDSFNVHINTDGRRIMGKFWGNVNPRYDIDKKILVFDVKKWQGPEAVSITFKGKTEVFGRQSNNSVRLTDEEIVVSIRNRMDSLHEFDEKVMVLQEAMRKKQKVRLIHYLSSNSGNTRNRLVEPHYIDDERYEYVICYDCEGNDKKNKMFLLSRMDRVELANSHWEKEAEHDVPQIDAFLYSGDSKTKVKLRLKLPAKNMLVEMYPRTKDCLKRMDEDTWMFETEVFSLTPLLSFYVGYAQYIEIEEAEGLLEKVQQHINKYIPLIRVC